MCVKTKGCLPAACWRSRRRSRSRSRSPIPFRVVASTTYSTPPPPLKLLQLVVIIFLLYLRHTCSSLLRGCCLLLGQNERDSLKKPTPPQKQNKKYSKNPKTPSSPLSFCGSFAKKNIYVGIYNNKRNEITANWKVENLRKTLANCLVVFVVWVSFVVIFCCRWCYCCCSVSPVCEKLLLEAPSAGWSVMYSTPLTQTSERTGIALEIQAKKSHIESTNTRKKL